MGLLTTECAAGSASSQGMQNSAGFEVQLDMCFAGGLLFEHKLRRGSMAPVLHSTYYLTPPWLPYYDVEFKSGS